MSETRMDQNVDQMLAAWMEDVAPERPPTRLLEETFAQTLKASQARTYPWHKLGIGALGLPRAGSGNRAGALVFVALIVAALAVGLVGGLGLVTPPVPSPSPTLEPVNTPVSTPVPTEAPLPATIAVTPEAVIPVEGPITMVSLGSSMWVMGAGDLSRIDSVANAVTASVTLGSPTELYNGLAANDAGLWATNSDAALLYRVDPASLEVVARIPAGVATKGVLAETDAVWVADVHGGAVLRIDPATNLVVATIIVGPTGSSGPNWLASGLGSIWVNIPNNSTVVRIDPVSNAIQATIEIPVNVVPCGGFEFETNVVWVTGCGGTILTASIDPATNTVTGTAERIGGIPTLVNGGPWFSVDTGDGQPGLLMRIDRATNAIDRVLQPTGPFGGGGGLVVFAGSVWIIDEDNNAVVRLPVAAFGP